MLLCECVCVCFWGVGCAEALTEDRFPWKFASSSPVCDRLECCIHTHMQCAIWHSMLAVILVIDSSTDGLGLYVPIIIITVYVAGHYYYYCVCCRALSLLLCMLQGIIIITVCAAGHYYNCVCCRASPSNPWPTFSPSLLPLRKIKACSVS